MHITAGLKTSGGEGGIQLPPLLAAYGDTSTYRILSLFGEVYKAIQVRVS